MELVFTLVMLAAVALGAVLGASRRKGLGPARSGAGPSPVRPHHLAPARDTPFAPRAQAADAAGISDARTAILAAGLVFLAGLAGAQAPALLQLYTGYGAKALDSVILPYTMMPLLLGAAVVFAVDGRGLSAARGLAAATTLAAFGLYVAQRQVLESAPLFPLMILNGAAFAAEPLAIAWLARQGLANPLWIGVVAAGHTAGFALRINLLGSLGSGASPGLFLLIVALALGVLAWRRGDEERNGGYDPRPTADLLRDPQLLSLAVVLILTTLGFRFAPYAVVDQFAFSQIGMGRADAAFMSFLTIAGALAGGLLARRGVKLAPFVSVICLAAILLLVVSVPIDKGSLKLLIVMLLPGLAAMTAAPLYTAFQNCAGPGSRALAAVAPVAMTLIIGILLSGFVPHRGLAFLLSAVCLAGAAVIGLGGPAAVKAMMR